MCGCSLMATDDSGMSSGLRKGRECLQGGEAATLIQMPGS